MIVFYSSISFSKLIWLQKNKKQKKLFQIFIYFSKPLRLLFSLIIYEIVNFLSSLFATSFFLSISEKCSYTRDCSYMAERRKENKDQIKINLLYYSTNFLTELLSDFKDLPPLLRFDLHRW